MNEELFRELEEAEYMPFDIETLSKDELIDKMVFDYLLTIDDKFKREKVILKLEERAKKEKCLSSFKTLLKEYIKKESIVTEKLKHNDVAKKLLKENSIVLYQDTLYIYVNGVYTDDTRVFERKIIDIIPDANSFFRKEVCKNLVLEAKTAMIDKESGILNFKNGLYSIEDKKLYPHTPSFFSINQINTNFNENAKTVQAVDTFLDKISTNKPKRRQSILEMIGYCMTPSVKLQKAFVLYGETARNGKSTLANLITELIGRGNTSNISFKEINTNRFAASKIKGKLLNIGSEMNDDYIGDVSILKMLITGDYLEVEEKFKAKETLSPYAKFIFNANVLPHVADKTNGFYRRLQIIPLETSFTEEDSKKFNFKELISEKALEYLAKISVEAYLSMGEYFSNEEESAKEVNKYKRASNSVLSFATNKEAIYSLCSKIKTHKAVDVYEKYKDYCQENQFKSVGRSKFYEEIEKSKILRVGERNHQKTYTFLI